MTLSEEELLQKLDSAIQDLLAGEAVGHTSEAASAGVSALLVEIRQCADAIRSRIAHAASIIDATLDAFISIDRQGRIVQWNARAEEMFGWSRDEVMGRSLAETIIPTSYRNAHRRGLQRFIETGEGHVINQLIEVTALRRDGFEFPIDLKVFAPLPAVSADIFSAFIRLRRPKAVDPVPGQSGAGGDLHG